MAFDSLHFHFANPKKSDIFAPDEVADLCKYLTILSKEKK